MRWAWLIALALALAASDPRPALAASAWGNSPYPDPPGFCTAGSRLPSTYQSVATNDPHLGLNPEQDTFWGYHANPGYDNWYGFWQGGLNGGSGVQTGWRLITTSIYPEHRHWNFSDWQWYALGHLRQYIAYYNWSFGGWCGMGFYGSDYPPPYLADVDGAPVVDFWVDTAPPDPPVPHVTGAGADWVSFAWDPVSDRGSGAGLDYYASGLDHYRSWLTVDGGAAQQSADTAAPRPLTARGLRVGARACVHVIAFDRVTNATPEQVLCAAPASAPPPPPAPSAARIAANPRPAGLVGTPTWLWLDPAPQPLVRYADVGGHRYRYTQTPGAVQWAFGDGQAAVGDAGRAYPQQSTVAHSFSVDSADGYAIEAVQRWTVTWALTEGSGGWSAEYALADQQVAERELVYPVLEAQPELLGA